MIIKHEGSGRVSTVKIKKHVNLHSPLLPELVACLLTHFLCLPMMYKGGKNHIKPTDFLNFYTSKRGVMEIKGNIKVGRSTGIRLKK